MGWNKKYTWEFDLWGCVLGLLFLAPVLLWLAAPASVAALSEQNHGAILEAGTLILGLLCFLTVSLLKNRGYAGEKRELNWRDGFALACGCGYYAAWICYYQGRGGSLTPAALLILPCMGLLAFEMDRRKGPAAALTCMMAVLLWSMWIF